MLKKLCNAKNWRIEERTDSWFYNDGLDLHGTVSACSCRPRDSWAQTLGSPTPSPPPGRAASPRRSSPRLRQCWKMSYSEQTSLLHSVFCYLPGQCRLLDAWIWLLFHCRWQTGVRILTFEYLSTVFLSDSPRFISDTIRAAHTTLFHPRAVHLTE